MKNGITEWLADAVAVKVGFYRRLEKKIRKKLGAATLAPKLIAVMWRMFATGDTDRRMDTERYTGKLTAPDRAAALLEPYPAQEIITKVLAGNLKQPGIRTKVPA